MIRQRIGGTFAPPLSDELLANYKAMIDALPDSPVKEAMSTLHTCCAKWWELPESDTAPQRHPTGAAIPVVALSADNARVLWDHIPWKEELEMLKGLFERINPRTEQPLRNAAFHLLWHAIELENDREPLTADKLG
jgi:hypothetical protein